MLTGFVLWYASGIIATSLFAWYNNRQCNMNLTYGDIAFIVLLGLSGLIAVAAIPIFAVLVLIVRIVEHDVWDKPVFAKTCWKD